MEAEIGIQYSESLANTDCIVDEQTWLTWFTHWLELLTPGLSPIQSYSLSLRLTDDHEIQRLNTEYRNRDLPTDVLSFAALEILDPDAPPPIQWQTDPVELGDIVISLHTALRQAPEHEHSSEQELAWLASHGLLHLLGWDHPDPVSLDKMLMQQDELLSASGLL